MIPRKLFLAALVPLALLCAVAYVAYSPRPAVAFIEAMGALGMIGMAYSGGAPQIMSASEAAQARNTNAIMQNWVDRGPWQYWDMIYFANAAAVPSQIQVFQNQIGAVNTQGAVGGPTNGVAKSKLQTNLTRSASNGLPPPRCLLLLAIEFQFSPNFLKPDIDAIVNTAYMEFRIDDKIFHEGSLIEFPSGGGVTGVTQNSGESCYTLALPAPQFSRRYQDWAKYIAPLQQFSMVLNFGGGGIVAPTIGTGSTAGNYVGGSTSGTQGTTGGQSAFLRVVLDGLTDRSVQ